jgi:ferredoxin
MHYFLCLVISMMAVHVEGFGQGSRFGAMARVGRMGSSALEYKVTIVEGDKKTVLDVEGETTVLEAALEAGIELEYDCQMGVCLTCPSKVVCGKVSQDGGTLDDSVAEEGYALTCVSRPLSDCEIHVIDEEELVSAQFAGR